MTKKNKAKPRAKKVAKPKSVAPGQHLGYSTQETVLAHRLLTAPPRSFLSVEVLDDVAVSKGDGSTEAIQIKSALVTNPVSDHASSLWKTLFNWLALLDQDAVVPSQTVFVLYVSKKTNANIAAVFSTADTPALVANAIEDAKDAMWGPLPKRTKRAKLPKELAYYVDSVLDHPRLPQLVARFRLEFGSGSPVSDFEADLAKQIIADGVVTQLSEQVLGWVRRRTALSMEQQEPAVVSRDEFYAEMSAFLRKIAFRQIIDSFARAPTAAEQQAQLSRIFVRQLQLIELEDDDVLHAISDFLRAVSDRVDWARLGLIHETSFDTFDQSLQGAWSNHRIKARAQHPSAPISCGQCLYGDCMTFQTHLQGLVTPAEFIRGCFHALADEFRIGWHPEYKKLMHQ